MHSESQAPVTEARYEVGHLEIEAYKFVVTKLQALYRFYASYKLAHSSIVEQMQKEERMSKDEQVIGGGFIEVRNKKLILESKSGAYGSEPDFVRLAFRPLVIAKLREMNIEVDDD